jgi:hypothetical protein
MHGMRTAPATPRRTFEQRAALFAFVVALVLAPALANVWPAFGKGEMLFVGDAAATQTDHAAHQGHHAAATEAQQPHTQHRQSHHQTHCALCVLAFLGWAPPIDLSIGCTTTCLTERTKPLVASAPRVLLLWPSAQARAPPSS